MWRLSLLISLYGFLNLPANTSCTSPSSKKNVLLLRSFPPRVVSERILKLKDP